MYKVSEIISKQIISIFEGEKIGTIKDVFFSNDYKKVQTFVFFDDEGDFNSAVLAKNTYKTTTDGILIKNLSKIIYNHIGTNNPINTSVFLLDGTCLGKISDVIFDQNFNVLKFCTSKKQTFLPSQIVNIGFDVCLVKNQNAKVSISAFKPQAEFAKTTQQLEDLKVKLVRLAPAQNPEEEKDNAPPTFPTKIKPNTNTLLGKTATRTITGINNEIIIKQNAIISKHTLDMAKIHNKVYELMLSSL